MENEPCKLCNSQKFLSYDKCVFHFYDLNNQYEDKLKRKIWNKIKPYTEEHRPFPKNAKLCTYEHIKVSDLFMLNNDCEIFGNMNLIIYDKGDSNNIIINIKDTDIDGDVNISISNKIEKEFNKNIIILFENVNIEKGSINIIENMKIKQVEFIKCKVKKIDFLLNKEIKNLIIRSDCKINTFKLHQSSIEEYIYIDSGCTFEKIDFGLSKFNGKTVFGLNVGELGLKDTIFNKSIKFQGKSKIGKIDFENSLFEEVMVFKDIEFKEKVDFKNAMFEKKVLFDNTYLNDTINLENCIFKDEVNFINLKSKKNSNSIDVENRETARIIKYSFDKIGNIIEANKYYAFEIKKTKKELYATFNSSNKKQTFLDLLVFIVHGIFSNHSQNYLLVIFWIFIVGSVTAFWINQSLHIDEIFKYMLIVTKFDKDSNNIAMFFNKVFLSYLYYQFVVTIRSNTRRK